MVMVVVMIFGHEFGDDFNHGKWLRLFNGLVLILMTHPQHTVDRLIRFLSDLSWVSLNLGSLTLG
jgi:hypothetical protein